MGSITSDPSPSNITGAFIFLSYIILALLLTGLISYDLFSSSRSLQSTQSPPPLLGRNIQIFTALATLNFSALSYHVISFLVVFYCTWATERRVALPPGISGYGDIWPRGLELHLWDWVTTSTLFRDFGEVICERDGGFWWTQFALMVTVGCTCFMSVEGRCGKNWHYNRQSILRMALNHVVGIHF